MRETLEQKLDKFEKNGGNKCDVCFGRKDCYWADYMCCINPNEEDYIDESLLDKKMNNQSLLERSIARIKRGVLMASEKPEENKEAIEELKFILEVLEASKDDNNR